MEGPDPPLKSGKKMKKHLLNTFYMKRSGDTNRKSDAVAQGAQMLIGGD